MITIKYYLYTIGIALLKPLVYLEKKYNQFKQWEFETMVKNQVLASYNYDIKAILALKNNK